MRFSSCLSLSLLLAAAAVGYAQPSGGPYGPIDQRYEVPKAPHVYFVAPDGKTDAPGTLDQPTTLEAAIDKVVTGDAVILRGGVYRTGGLVLNQGITIQPYLEERPIVKGTEVPARWQPLRNNIWRTPWKKLFPASPLGWWQRASEGARTPMHRFNNDMVFVNGRLLKSAGWEGELDANTFYIDYQAGFVYIGADPKDKLVEITAYDSALVRTSKPAHNKTSDRKGPVIRGITFTQYAYRALEVEGKKSFTVNEEPTDEPVGLSDPSTFGKEVTGTVLENLTITFCSRVGGFFRGDGLVVRNCLFSDTSTEGLYVIGSSDVVIERSIFRRNNVEQITGYYPAAVKIFNQTRRVVFRDNLITDQANSNGVWYDVGNRDAVVVNNYIEGVQNGFFFEISRGAIVAGNVFVRCDPGVRALNSADVRVYNNTFVDSRAMFDRDQRSAAADHFGWHPSTGPDVNERTGHVFVNNLLVAGDTYNRPFLHLQQPKPFCEKLTTPLLKEAGSNLYVRAADPAAAGAPAWNPVSAGNCTTLPGTPESTGQQMDRTARSIFKGFDTGRYELRQPLQATPAPLPADVRKALGWSEEEARTVGAFPVKK